MYTNEVVYKIYFKIVIKHNLTQAKTYNMVLHICLFVYTYMFLIERNCFSNENF